jgi:AAA+ ATPase superfamily predicted ATPase
MENEVFNSIRKELNSYTGKMFEGVCKEFIINSKFFSAVKIGGWWHKDKEIDIVALNDQTKDILFAECKWGNKIDAREVLKGLKEKSKLVDFNAKSITYAVFAKSFKERFREPNVFLFDLDGMKRSFIKA